MCLVVVVLMCLVVVILLWLVVVVGDAAVSRGGVIVVRSQVLRCRQVNINPLCNKIDYVSVFIREQDLDMLVVSETGLVEGMQSSLVAVDGFSIVRDTNCVNRKHGVFLYIKGNLKFVEMDMCIPNVVAIHLVELDIYVLAVHHPPFYRDAENEALLSTLLDSTFGRETICLRISTCQHCYGSLMVIYHRGLKPRIVGLHIALLWLDWFSG